MLVALVGLNAQLVLTSAELWITPAKAMAATAIDAEAPAASGSPRIVIPKLNVEAPLVMGMSAVDERSVQTALEHGVLHFGGTPEPGSGNSVYVGHSSNSVWNNGSYKFVFALLDRLQPGDTFYLVNGGVRYSYRVSSSRVVRPDDISVLAQTLEPTVTLITCTPVGTSWNRLVVTAVQTSPAPTPITKAAVVSVPQHLPGD